MTHRTLLTQCIPGWASSYIPISSKCVGLSAHKLPAGPLEGGGQWQPRLRREAERPARTSCKHLTPKPTQRNEHPPPSLFAAPEYKLCLLPARHHLLFDESTSIPRAVACQTPRGTSGLFAFTVTRGLTQLPQFWCHRCLLDAHVKPTTTFTARDRNQQLNRSASTRTLYPDASARSGRATNHHDHVGVTMLAFTFVGNAVERGGGVMVVGWGVRWLKGGRGNSAGGQLRARGRWCPWRVEEDTTCWSAGSFTWTTKTWLFSPNVNRARLTAHSGTTKGSHPAPLSPFN